MLNEVYNWFEIAYSYIAYLSQNIFLTNEGQQLANKRSLFISEKLKEAQQNGKSSYTANITRSFGLFKSPFQVCAIDTSSLKESSIMKVTSGTEDPQARQPFSNFGKMMGLSENSPLSWFLKQDQKAYDDRQLLANMMKPDKLASLNLKVTAKLETWYKETINEPIPCLFQSMHQLVMECIGEEILGLTQLPKYAHTVIEHAEEAITHETEGFTVLGWGIYITPSQQKFKVARENFLKLATDIVNDNAETIKNGDGYLAKILEQIKGDMTNSEAFAVVENQKLLGSVAVGLLLATGGLSVTLTFALLHLNKNMLDVINEKKILNRQKDFIDYYFKEALRYAASGQTFRFASMEKELQTEDNTTINIPPNTLICLNVRSAASNNTHWPQPNEFNPDRFQSADVPKMHTAKFSPFLLGPRMCPGRHVAEVIFKEVINFFVQNNLSVKASDEVKDVNNEDYWTANDFTIRPQLGKTIAASMLVESCSNKLSARN